MLDFANLSFTNIIFNALLAGLLGTLLVHALLFIIFRLFNYDYIFLRETGLLLVEDSRSSPSIIGFLLHLLTVIAFMLLYAIPYQVLLVLLSNNELGIYQYSSSLLQQDKTFLNLVYFTPFALIFIIIWIYLARKSEGESQYPLLIIYCILNTFVSIIIFSFYGFGHLEPGIVTLN